MNTQIKRKNLEPLSFFKYFQNNLKKSLVITIALILSVFMVIIFQMIIFAVNEPARLGDLKFVEYVTRVFPGDKGVIDKKTYDEFFKSPYSDKLIHVKSQNMDYTHFFGTCGINTYFMDKKDMLYLMKRLNMRLIKGRMPEPGKNELLLDWKTLNNKNKKLGDFIGKEVDKEEKLPGKYKIVGILSGDLIIGFCPVNATSDLNYLLVVAKDGMIDRLNSSIKDITHDKAYLWNKDMSLLNYKNNADNLNMIFGIISIAIIFVIAFSSGNSSYAQYYSRRYEFGLLQSIGYTRSQILLRAAKEISCINLAGFTGGVILGLITGLILNKVFFIPNGYPFRLIQPDGLIKAVTIPLCTTVFGLIPAAWLLSKIDPMMVIEKFE